MRFERKKIDFISEINYQQKNNYLPNDIYDIYIIDLMIHIFVGYF